MRTICPNCEKETRIELIRTKEPLTVRGEEIIVEAEFFKCLECSEEFENTRSADPLEVAYWEYRRRHGMLQPEEIRDWRKSLGLTQRELSALLGWGDATLSRYENGALQDEAHEKMLRLTMQPHNLLELIKKSPDALNGEKRKKLIEELSAVEAEACSFDRIYEEQFGKYVADDLSGYKKLDLYKFSNVILFFCQEGQLKTKLNKLLFYADFKHFKEHTVSITGARYAHLPYGPVPDDYDFYFASLRKKGYLSVDEVQVYQYHGEFFTSQKRPDLNLFSDSELRTLEEVKEFFKDYSASQIKDFSHREQGYLKTSNREIISYKEAMSLQI